MNQNKAIAFLSLLVLGIVYLLFMFLAWITREKVQIVVSFSLPPGTYRLIIYALHGNGDRNRVYSNSLVIR